MDPELRGYLEALGEKIEAVRVVAVASRDEAAGARQEALAAREEAAAAHQAAAAAQQEAAAARQGASGARQMAAAALERASAAQETAEEARREARILSEANLRAIERVADGLTMFRESAERHAADRERSLVERHIGPLEASARFSAKRLDDHDARIRALEAAVLPGPAAH